MKKITTLIVLFVTVCTYGQSLDLQKEIPSDSSFVKGVLSNGLTYYIKHTHVVKDAASYYIIQNVGSVLEEDNQSGLAHFLEHMAFNGTKHFPGKGILNTLEEYGAVFGKDINAYTSFDETVYNLNHIPTKDGLVDTCLTILHDWSNELLLTEEEIDAERGVIKEEWRTRDNGNMRAMVKSLPVLFNNTKYADRMPIGSMDVVENFEYSALRSFYHDWYRTDLQAIAIIGDVDVHAIEEKIKQKFSKIPAVENPKERYIIEIPDNDKMQYAFVTDKELKTALVTFGIRRKNAMENETIADLKSSLLNAMIKSMFSTRMEEIRQKPDAPFLGVRLNEGSHSRAAMQFSLDVYPKPNQQYEAFKLAMQELNRVVKFGFTKPEIDRTIVAFKSGYENYISKLDDRPHKKYADLIVKNYLNNKTIADFEKKYDIVKSIFNTLREDDFLKQIKLLYTEKNRYLVVRGVEGNKNLTEDDALAIINSVENDKTLQPYVDAFSGKTLVSDVEIKPGSIQSETYNEELDATTFVLSNGVKVHYKFADKNKNSVKLKAMSYGGKSLIEDNSYLTSANHTIELVNNSGVGNYNTIEMSKILAGNTARLSLNISDISEKVNGSATPKDFEVLMQRVYMQFMHPRFDENALKVFKNNLNHALKAKSENIGSKINDSTLVTLYGFNNPRHRLLSPEYIEDISFEKVKTIYQDRFADVSDFEFFIVGDIKKEDLKPVLENYLASIETKNNKEDWVYKEDNWLNDNIKKDIYLKMENPKATVRIAYKKEVKYTQNNYYLTKALGDILKLRLTASLRESEGGTYGAGVGAKLSKRPKEEAVLYVSFDCNPDKVEKLVEIVHEEMHAIANDNIKEEDLTKTKTNYFKEREQQKNYNSYDMNVLTNYFREGYNMNDPENFDVPVQALSKKHISQFAKKLLDHSKSYEIIAKPIINNKD
ncbi:insulinase family protein [Tamlana fucoidanivorans]|uniref:Insulinase family protein n=1 Tax=Allotamlana fucoidanivorans TaxID=2583814 RepID=A0A5C4SP65_9FLAO|nr:M16 family metallopeptidase [Tamlana fucoidanivorans]TNJ46001.1 insulinase family protein [Tamlana fucoidanivorans]